MRLSSKKIRGMASRGNMNPESRMLGSRAKKESCMACIWVRETLEMSTPMARLARMKRNVSR